MAITPTNLTVSPTKANSGDELIFTWEWDTTPQNEDESITKIRYYRFECIDPNSGAVIQTWSTGTNIANPQSKRPFAGYTAPPYCLIYRVYAVDSVGGEPIGNASNEVRVYDASYSGGTPEPVTGGRLEQFQNSAAEQIYPRTIVEGIFRQSDNKPLSELLSVIELPLRIEEGGTGAGNAQTALANLIDGTDTSFQAASYGDVYIPISINGAGYRMPFTKVQLWTIGDRKSAVNQTNTDYGIFMARGIAAGTSDYAAGSTAMTSGTIYLVYE